MIEVLALGLFGWHHLFISIVSRVIRCLLFSIYILCWQWRPTHLTQFDHAEFYYPHINSFVSRHKYSSDFQYSDELYRYTPIDIPQPNTSAYPNCNIHIRHSNPGSAPYHPATPVAPHNPSNTINHVASYHSNTRIPPHKPNYPVAPCHQTSFWPP